MRTTQRALALLITVLLLLPSPATSQVRPQNDWLLLQRLTRGDKLRVELKQGGTIEGKLSGAADTALTLSIGNRTRDINQSDVRKIYVLSGKSVGTTTLKGAGVGAATGAAVGAGLGEDCTKSSGICLNRGTLAVIGAALFAIPGAIVGFVLGAGGHNRRLIYEA
jgi:hypothetical protein